MIDPFLSFYGNIFPGGADMDIFEIASRWLSLEFIRSIDWAITNWEITMIVLIVLIYWAGRQRRVDRHHL